MKIAAIANANALAHVSRLLEIAKVLRSRGHEILFGGYGEYLKVIESHEFPIRELPYISRQQHFEAIRSQKNLGDLYPYDQLEEFVKAELALYEEFKPDLVMVDNRPTARTSAEKAGLKTVAVLNAHMSPYRKIPFYSLCSHLKPLWLRKLAEPVDDAENIIESFFYDRIVMRDLNKLRRSLGLKRLYGYEHEAGDLSFLADAPEFNPVNALPQDVRFVGPLTWHNGLPPPACLEKLEAGRKTVYLTLGSGSLEELVERFGSLTQQGLQIVVACGKTECKIQQHSIPHVYFEEFVNTDHLLPSCDIVCCHGGNGTLYQALAFGLPIVAVATHAEQYYGARRIQQLGLGRVLTLKNVRRHGMGIVLDAILEVMQEPDYRNKSRDFSLNLQGWNGAEKGATEIENFGNSICKSM
jgi:UDP:flavonoid glycosyltransferase YjiC (YdhE family)